jgi:hypothetical protein
MLETHNRQPPTMSVTWEFIKGGRQIYYYISNEKDVHGQGWTSSIHSYIIVRPGQNYFERPQWDYISRYLIKLLFN